MSKLFVISGQAGVGKNTIIRVLQKRHPEFYRVVTYTTRKPRPSEIPGEERFFVDSEKFQEMIEKGDFFEYAEVHGEMYGTPKAQIERALKEGKNVFMEIEVRGMAAVKKTFLNVVSIFIAYEDGDLLEIIRERIKNDKTRGEISEAEIQRRYQTALNEAECKDQYDYIVVNPEGQAEKAIEEVDKIIKENLKNGS